MRNALLLMLPMLLAACGGCGPKPPGETPPLLVFGRSGTGPGEFNYPRAATVGPDQTLYVIDKAGRLQAFSAAGEFLRAWRMPAIDAGKPTGLGIGPDGRIYAADTHYSRVLVFAPDGRLVEQFGTHGDGPGQFRLPTDVAVAPDGTIFVSEYGGNDRISVFAPGWRFLRSFDGRDDGRGTRFERPQALSLDRDGTLWVADAGNHRICHFSRAGRLLGTFGRPGHDAGQLWFPYDVAVLADGTLVVCEYGNNRVQRFDRDGRSLGIWGRAGRRPGELAYPWALAPGTGDRLYVIDSGNNRVQVIDAGHRNTWSMPRSKGPAEAG